MDPNTLPSNRYELYSSEGEETDINIPIKNYEDKIYRNRNLRVPNNLRVKNTMKNKRASSLSQQLYNNNLL